MKAGRDAGNEWCEGIVGGLGRPSKVQFMALFEEEP
jgi:hypothetical protein